METTPTTSGLPAKRVRGKVEKITQNEIDEVNERYDQIHKAAAEVAAEVIELGEKLTSIKNRIRHGRWEKWVEKNLSFSNRTALRFMRAYEIRSTLPNVDPQDFMADVWGNKPKQLKPKTDVTSDLDVNEDDDTQHGGKGFEPGFDPGQAAMSEFKNTASQLNIFFEDAEVSTQQKLEFISELIKWLEDRRKQLGEKFFSSGS